MATIIIVEDAPFVRKMLRAMLTEDGHEVIAEAANGLEATILYKNLQPDLVTMDFTMPVMDGISAVKEILSYDPTAKIIMCSAMEQKEMILEAILSGARDFLIKPFTKDRISEAISHVLGS